ncbi:MAG: EamA family transporter [Rhodospirillum sp.]|nr:EamA family transporter [Rhodospirillum sp.]MCF8488791.1 EamA family transporter [Rhodospirillum sp.]MCF8502225.1 EamA family transporter [Rhodospirillum sp.]
MGLLDTLAALTVATLWGMNFVVVKTGVGDMPPFLLTTLRFALAAALVTPFLRLERRHIKQVILLSVTFGTVHFALLFTAINMVDAATAAIIIQLGTPFATLGAVLFFKERMDWVRWVGLFLAFLGVVLVAGEPHLGSPLAIFILVVSALGWASSNLIMKTIHGANPVTMSGWLSLFALPQSLVLSLWFEGDPLPLMARMTWVGWSAVIYTGLFASIVSHSLWYNLLDRYPVTGVTPFALLAPIIGICAGIFLLGEQATPEKLVGGAVTLFGVALIEIWGRRVDSRRKRALPRKTNE